MSILDSITAAESQAAELRAKAGADGRELLHGAESQANQRAAGLIESARRAAERTLEAAQEKSGPKGRRPPGETGRTGQGSRGRGPF